MLYFIGGASRSGKYQLVMKLLSEKGVPYFPLDSLMMACSKKPECFKMTPQDSPEKRSSVLWPFTEEVVNTTSYHLDNYAFEGDYILPENVKTFREKYSYRQCRAVFLGYADVDPAQKMRDIRQFASSTDWTRNKSDDLLLQHINVHIALSVRLKAQCASYGFAYFEASNNFTEYLNDAYQSITRRLSS